MTKPLSDLTEIKRAILILFKLGDVVELRALGVQGKIHAGYFNDFEKLATEAAQVSGQADGVYVILNQINPDLLARSQNRITISPKNLTQDKDIICRRWLPIDIDPIRPAGISSTDGEHNNAINTAQNIKKYLISDFKFSQDSFFFKKLFILPFIKEAIVKTRHLCNRMAGA